MKFYIETKNGQPINHPAFEDNLLNALGWIPDRWEPFIRVEKPETGVYQVFNSHEPTYQKIDGAWTDVWDIRDMTPEEKLKAQQDIKDVWNSNPDIDNFSTWIYNEDKNIYEPPIPYPTDTEKHYRWDGNENNWVEI